MKPIKVIIAGSRGFDNYELLKAKCDVFLAKYEDIEIVSGTASGADKLGERYAREKGHKLKQFPANWSLGKSAGFKRNEEMARYAGALICFWDGKSRGSRHMLDLAEFYGLKIRLVTYEE